RFPDELPLPLGSTDSPGSPGGIHFPAFPSFPSLPRHSAVTWRAPSGHSAGTCVTRSTQSISEELTALNIASMVSAGILVLRDSWRAVSGFPLGRPVSVRYPSRGFLCLD